LILSSPVWPHPRYQRPTLCGRRGKALYLWDSDGNYIQLEADENPRPQFPD